jgi:hypothetical protein
LALAACLLVKPCGASVCGRQHIAIQSVWSDISGRRRPSPRASLAVGQTLGSRCEALVRLQRRRSPLNSSAERVAVIATEVFTLHLYTILVAQAPIVKSKHDHGRALVHQTEAHH